MREIGAKKLRIAIVSPPWFPVPPSRYGGIESVVSLLTEGLCRRGHDVTLFASGDSRTAARLASIFTEAQYKELKGSANLENAHSLSAYALSSDFDIIHDHNGFNSRLLGALVSRLFNKPLIATLHGPADLYSRSFYDSVASDLLFIAISESQRASYAGLNFISTIPNAINIDDYPFSTAGGDYMLFVGRMNEEKGAHIAAKVAKKLGRKLIMVGKCSEKQEIRYFNEKVKPNMGKTADYYGEVDQATKLELYRNAQCLLFPIQWAEPFGLVMIESMACGTPVIAIRNGSVPEVVKHGRTGYIVEDEGGMTEAVKHIGNIDRLECRTLISREYNEDVFIARHEKAYMDALKLSDKKRDR